MSTDNTKIYRWLVPHDAPHPAFEIWQDNNAWLVTMHDKVQAGHFIEISRLNVNLIGFERSEDKGDIKESNWLELLVVLGLARERAQAAMSQVDTLFKIALVSDKATFVYDMG